MLVDYINEAKNKIEYGENNLGWHKGLSVSVNDEVGAHIKIKQSSRYKIAVKEKLSTIIETANLSGGVYFINIEKGNTANFTLEVDTDFKVLEIHCQNITETLYIDCFTNKIENLVIKGNPNIKVGLVVPPNFGKDVSLKNCKIDCNTLILGSFGNNFDFYSCNFNANYISYINSDLYSELKRIVDGGYDNRYEFDFDVNTNCGIFNITNNGYNHFIFSDQELTYDEIKDKFKTNKILYNSGGVIRKTSVINKSISINCKKKSFNNLYLGGE